jgi:hypothetical protein
MHRQGAATEPAPDNGQTETRQAKEGRVTAMGAGNGLVRHEAARRALAEAASADEVKPIGDKAEGETVNRLKALPVGVRFYKLRQSPSGPPPAASPSRS